MNINNSYSNYNKIENYSSTPDSSDLIDKLEEFLSDPRDNFPTEQNMI